LLLEIKYLRLKTKNYNTSFRVVEVSNVEYNELYLRCSNTNLLQCSSYIIAKGKVDKLEYKFFKILNLENVVVAICGVLLKKVFILGYMARINRGPLLIEQNSMNSTVAIRKSYLTCIKALRDFGRRNRWLGTLIAPNILISNENVDFSLRNGFVKWGKGNFGYCSATLDLQVSEESLFNNLQGKWRNLLRKSLKLNLTISTWTGDFDEISDLIAEYDSFKREKSFVGVSSDLIYELANNFSVSRGDFKYFFVQHNEEIIGRLVTIIHGDTCTYFIGMSSEIGRIFNVNYLMLWHSIVKAKENGCRYFDLGGINYILAPSIGKFKDGLSGVNYNLTGEYLLF